MESLIIIFLIIIFLLTITAIVYNIFRFLRNGKPKNTKLTCPKDPPRYSKGYQNFLSKKSSEKMSHCKSCGSILDIDSDHCLSCGLKI